jgi:hypothetical protein
MRNFCLALLVLLLASPAYAQLPPISLSTNTPPTKTQEEKDAEAVRDKAYRESLKKIPDAKPPADPWGNVRSNDNPKVDKSASTKKTKTGGAN